MSAHELEERIDVDSRPPHRITRGPDLHSPKSGCVPFETSPSWHLAAVLAMGTLALFNMRGWFGGDLLPPHDFAGYVTAVEDVRDAVFGFGRVPEWSSRWFAGSTRFTSSLKELVTFPLTILLDPIRAVQVMVFVMKVLAGLTMYALFVRFFRSPAVGMVAGYAYAFSTPSNYDTSVHLHVSFSYVFSPLIFCSAVELLRRRRAMWAVALGILMACQFLNNYVLVGVPLAIVILLLMLRPWRRASGEEHPPEDKHEALRWGALLGMTLIVFGILAASQLAWLATDLRNHALHSPEHVAWGVERFIEHSPFVYFNRENWLGSWLANHHPLAMPLFAEEPLRNQRHYLGMVAMVVCAAGWFPARRHHALRRWYQLFALLFLLQYWLSMGPNTFLEQIARTFHWPDSVDLPLHVVLTATSLGCLAWALVRYLRHRGSLSEPRTHRIELALGLALLFWFVSHSLFEAARHILPPLQGMRAPGRFFELAPFAFYSLFGVGLVAIERTLPSPRLRRIVILTTALLVVVDFWPGAAAFRRGTSARAVREFRELVAELPAEDGTLRIALCPWEYALPESFVAVASQAGVAWSWLPWQAGKYWQPYYRAAMLWLAEEFDPEEREIYRPVSEALGRIGRLKYFIGHPRHDLGSPWKLRRANETIALWERDHVMPMASGYRSYGLFVGENQLTEALSLYRASEHNLLLISGGERLSQNSPGLIDGAALLLCDTDSALADDRSRILADRYASKLVLTEVSELHVSSPFSLSAENRARLLDVRYSRPSPTHIVLETEAGDEPAAVFVSEAYHPWWHAAVDGQPTRVLRAHMTFMAVLVSPGRHTIDMRLERPGVVEAADWITAISWVALGLAAAVYGILRLERRRA